MADLREAKKVRRACARSISGHGRRSPLASARELLESLAEDEQPDVYGAGALIEEFEAQVAALLGKEAAVFMPSGTMAQQIALRVACDARGDPRVAYHASSHLHLHERNALVELHRLEVHLLGDPRRTLLASDIDAVDHDLGALLIELPQRELGGVLPTWDALESLLAAARGKGAAVHLDGARLWETTPYYERTPAEIAAGFDSVYVSFYKGLGGIAGAALAGTGALVAQAKIWQRRHGGNLISLWPYVVSARASLAQRLERMPLYVAHMRAFADALREAPGVEVTPDPPPTNMAHIRLPGDPDALARATLEVSRESGVWLAHRFDATGRFELSVGDASLEVSPDELASLLRAVLAKV